MSEIKKKRYRKSLQQQPAATEGQGEFKEELPRGAVMLKRRDFLRVAGFTAAAAVATGCSRAPVQKAIPMLIQPEEIVPGTSLQYATTCAGCSAGCGVLAKVRDGRPIKLEGNPEHPLSNGGLCAVGQASLLGLYDSRRLAAPIRRGNKTSWEEVDSELTKQFTRIRHGGGSVRFLTNTTTSPTERSAIQSFLATARCGASGVAPEREREV